MIFWINPFQKIFLSRNWYTIAVTTENAHLKNTANFNHFVEGILLQTAFLLKIGIECIALLIIALAVLKSMQKLPFVLQQKNRQGAILSLRLNLGMALALSLEFLLAADIAATAVSPNWDSLGKLAAISGIRTFLNFFLQQEVKELEVEKSQNSTD